MTVQSLPTGRDDSLAYGVLGQVFLRLRIALWINLNSARKLGQSALMSVMRTFET